MRIFAICILVIQVVIVLLVKGVVTDHVSLAFWIFFREHKWIIWYIALINIAGLILFGLDKLRAAEHKWRIPVNTLLIVAFIGGSVGSWAAMYLYRHKTQKNYFKIGIPMMMVMQIVVLLYLMNLP